MEILGLVLPLAILAAFARPADGVTHPRYYIAPGIAAVLAIFAVLNTKAGPTPDFWVGLSAGLAAIAAGGAILIIQGFMPLEWWVKDAESPEPAPPADQAA